MGNFKIREQVVCIKKGAWIVVDGTPTGPDPIYNEIYTISFFDNFKNQTYFGLKELDPLGSWYSGNFRKLDYGFVEEVLEMIMEDELIIV